MAASILVDPAGRSASILMVNTTDTGTPASASSHPQSNTEPDPESDLRITLRNELITRVFPQYASNLKAGKD